MTHPEVDSLESLIYTGSRATPLREIKGDGYNFNENDFEVLQVERYNVVTISF